MGHRSVQKAAILVAAFGLAVAACDAAEVFDPTTTTVPTTTEADPSGEPEESEDDSASPVRRRAAELPGPRTEVAGTVWQGVIVAIGGLDERGAAMSNTDLYDPTTDSWSRGPDVPVPLHHTAVATLGERLYVVGGYTIEAGTWVAQSAVWSLGPGEDDWREEPPLATPRGALAVASTGDRLVAVGGVGPGPSVLTSTEVLDTGGASWQPGPDLIEPREHLAATAVGDEVYVIAGRAGGMATNLASTEVLRDGAWEQGPALGFSRGGIGAAPIHDIPCVTGGEEPADTIGSIECLISDAWEVVDELEVARHGLLVVALDGALHVIGGGPQPGLTVSGAHEVIPIPAP